MSGLNRQTAIDHLSAIDGVTIVETWGETSFFYNPGHRFKRGAYFATIKDVDSENDKASNLSREGVWRLNMGICKQTYRNLFGPPPPRPAKGHVIDGPWDLTALDTLTPHPIYGWMNWVAILNPSIASWASCQPLIVNAAARAKQVFERRLLK